jgi:hypothetical protein
MRGGWLARAVDQKAARQGAASLGDHFNNSHSTPGISLQIDFVSIARARFEVFPTLTKPCFISACRWPGYIGFCIGFQHKNLKIPLSMNH